MKILMLFHDFDVIGLLFHDFDVIGIIYTMNLTNFNLFRVGLNKFMSKIHDIYGL
jgi:hypothetical protein